jgi:hypothetical protein
MQIYRLDYSESVLDFVTLTSIKLLSLVLSFL